MLIICQKKTKKNEKVKNMYHCMEIRRMDKFKMIKANTKRYELSVRIFNKDWKDKIEHI